MEREDLTATRFLTSRLFAGFVGVIGVWFFLRSDTLGFSAVAEMVGGESRLVAAGVGLALLILAALAFEKDRLRVRTAEVMEGLHQLLYGRDYQREREAIEILVTAMESGDAERLQSSHEHLSRLTGQNFAADARVWRSWWDANCARWSRAVAASDGVPPRPQEDEEAV